MTIRLLNEKKIGENKSAWETLVNEAMQFECRKQRRHELWILTCYVNLDLLEEYVGYLRENLRITDVYLLFNYAEIYKKGVSETDNKINEIKKKFSSLKINLEIKFLKIDNYLSHAKGYALVQRSKEELTDGVILITSANFTNLGFKGKNLEIGYISKKKTDIRNFIKTYKFLIHEIGFDLNEKISNQEEYLLEFATLSSGVFLHKWSGNLKQKIGVKYELTEKAKAEGALPDTLLDVGFELGDTFTRHILNIDSLLTKEISASFIKNNTIETHWGRWCPKLLWDNRPKKEHEFNLFVKKFQSLTEINILNELKIQGIKVQTKLQEDGYIKVVKENYLEEWGEKITMLKENTNLLSRYYHGYDIQKFPFLYEQKREVKNLFDSLKESIDNTVRKNEAMRLVLLALDEKDPRILNN